MIYMIRYDVIYMIYSTIYDIRNDVLTAIGLSPGGSTHLHTNSI